MDAKGPIQNLIEDIHYGMECGGGRFGFLVRLSPQDRKDFIEDLERVRVEAKALVEAGALKTPKDIIDYMIEKIMEKIAVCSIVAQLRPEIPKVIDTEVEDPEC